MSLFTVISLLSFGVTGFYQSANTDNLSNKKRTMLRMQGVVCLLFGILALFSYLKNSSFNSDCDLVGTS